MIPIDFRDLERLSALLDGQLSRAEAARLEVRLGREPDLAAMRIRLIQVRSLLHRTPRRRIPRNFLLTAKTAGIRPPLPRSVPALSWASVTAMLLFVLTLGTNLTGSFGFGAAAPRMASEAPVLLESVQADNAVPEIGVGGGTAQTTPTPETMALRAPEPTQAMAFSLPAEPPDSKAQADPVNVWLLIWSGAAALLLATAGLIRWASLRAFRKRNAAPRRY